MIARSCSLGHHIYAVAASAIIVGMNKLLSITLIAGFLVVDFLFFHDILKPGETISVAQYLTGFLSLLVFASSALSLKASFSHKA